MARTVQINVTIGESDNRVLGVVKAKYGLRDKGEAIGKLVSLFADQDGEEGELRPEFVQKMRAIEADMKKRGFKSRTKKDLDALFGMN